MLIVMDKCETQLVNMRTCKNCQVDQPMNRYTVAKGYHLYTCKSCMQVRNKAWAQANKENMRGYCHAYKQRNKEIIADRSKLYVQQNPETRKASTKAYRDKHKAEGAEYVRRRQAKLSQRTPSWLSQDDVWMMREAYKLAKIRSDMFGFSWHVDHIFPLHGRNVSGLHVPTNLQVISAKENLQKSNRNPVS